jgi:hypothetical protein
LSRWVGYFYLRGRSGTTPVAVQPQREGDKPPDIRAAVPGQSLGAGKGVEITFFDKADPTRVSMKIKTESSEPEPGGRYLVTKPQAMIYSKDGGASRTSARMKARCTCPTRRCPPSRRRCAAT